MNNQVSVLVLSTDHQQGGWEGLGLSWEMLSGIQVPIYVVTDNVPFSFQGANFHSLTIHKPQYSKFDFSNKVMQGLRNISTKYVLLMCDDMWPTHSIQFLLPQWVEFLESTRADALRIHEKLGWWDYELLPTSYFINDIPVLKMAQDSQWLLSHNATIWRKDFLEKVMAPDEDPWGNEFEGTRRISALPHNIFHYNFGWYMQSYNVRGGKLSGFGKAFITNLKYRKEFHLKYSELNRTYTKA